MARRCKECQCGLCKFFKQDRVSPEIGICEKHNCSGLSKMVAGTMNGNTKLLNGKHYGKKTNRSGC